DARHVGPLGHIQPAVLVGQAEDFVQAVRKAAEFHFFWIVRVSILDQPDFAAARADRHLAVGQHFEGTGLEHLPRRRRERQEFVVAGLGGLSRRLLQGFLFLSLYFRR